MDQQEIKEPVNAVGYSEGGIDLLLAAKLSPEKFKNLVLVAPGGMIGKDGFFKLASRFIKGSAKEAYRGIAGSETRGQTFTCLKELAKSFGKNPALAIREVWAIAHSDVTEIVKELTEKGIGISFVCGVDDETFPMYGKNKGGTLKEKTVQKHAGTAYKEQEDAGKEKFAGFYSVKGGHSELILHPEKYTALIENALRSLKKRQYKEIDKV